MEPLALPRRTGLFALIVGGGLILVACRSAPPRAARVDRFCALANPPRCPAASPTLDAREVERWGPKVLGKRILVRGSLQLERVVCRAPDPSWQCPSSPDEADVYVGSVLVRFSPLCRCSVHGGPSCPVQSSGQDAIVTGTFAYEEPDYDPARYVLTDVDMCSVLDATRR